MILKYPTNYIAITQYFSSSHHGIDLGWNSQYGGANVPIYASESGTVVNVVKNYNKTDTDTPNYGNYIKIKHNDEYETLYAHLAYNSISLNIGDTVTKGEQIGIMGNTGYSKGNHLHFEVYKNNKRVNPVLYTYAYTDQTISKNQTATEGIHYYEETKTKDPIEEITSLQNKIKELETEINELKQHKFSYTVTKTNNYKIKLQEGETLIIKG